jgi:hypothetical protein
MAWPMVKLLVTRDDQEELTPQPRFQAEPPSTIQSPKEGDGDSGLPPRPSPRKSRRRSNPMRYLSQKAGFGSSGAMRIGGPATGTGAGGESGRCTGGEAGATTIVAHTHDDEPQKQSGDSLFSSLTHKIGVPTYVHGQSSQPARHRATS